MPSALRALWRTLLLMILCGGAVAWANPLARSLPASRQHVPSGRETARQVNAQVPSRNLFQLAAQLKLRSTRKIPHVIRKTSPTYPVGHQDRFWILSEDQNRYFKMTATIQAETPHFYLYVQNGLNIPRSTLNRAAHTFEYHTYRTDRYYFGSEWTPGINGDPHIVCLVGDLRSSAPAGYFSSEDEYPRVVNPYSNQRQMFYINSANTMPGNTDFDMTLSHEFQHMIHWHMHPHENLWINEGMSMMAQWLNGYGVPSEANSYTAEPLTQLNTWSQANDFPHYGGAYLFLAYLYDRYGRKFIREMLADRGYTDFPLIDDVLRRLHASATSTQVFAQWVAANYIHDSSAGHRLYGYKQLQQRVDPQTTQAVPFDHAATIPPYAPYYTVISGLDHQKAFRLRFSAEPTVPVVGVDRPPPFWWSNRGDMMQTDMERTVDLRHAAHPVLQFQTWYDIEKDYDYTYVEVSTDGGKTYTTVRGTTTTATNPNGANYGNGYTGDSKGWHDESVALSAFAGRRITLRFQYVTDDGVNGQGMVLKNLEIPAIGWHDNYSGWATHGFLPIFNNAMPSNWTVELIAYTKHGVKVSRLSLSPSKHGSVLVNPAKNGLTKLVVVVFTTAPKTTVATRFELSAGPP